MNSSIGKGVTKSNEYNVCTATNSTQEMTFGYQSVTLANILSMMMMMMMMMMRMMTVGTLARSAVKRTGKVARNGTDLI